MWKVILTLLLIANPVYAGKTVKFVSDKTEDTIHNITHCGAYVIKENVAQNRRDFAVKKDGNLYWCDFSISFNPSENKANFKATATYAIQNGNTIIQESDKSNEVSFYVYGDIPAPGKPTIVK